MRLTSDQIERLFEGQEVVDCTLGQIAGSSPRESGAWMLVSEDQTLGTIGGGQLEYMVIDEARKMLRNDVATKSLVVPLGPEIGQCCGGRVAVDLVATYNPQPAIDRLKTEQRAWPDVCVFGAGHVGKALAQQLALLPLNPILIDQRKGEMPNIHDVQNVISPLPESVLRNAKPGSAIVILTHDHALDFLLAGEALTLGHFHYVGMIGSTTKRAVFTNWLKETYDGVVGAGALICPIGGAGVTDKRPEIIAALVVAEILRALDQQGQLSSTGVLEGTENAK